MEDNFVKRVFLGGTCGKYGSQWRNEVIKYLDKDIQYFNPLVPVWDDEAAANEEKEKRRCNIHLYVLTPCNSWYSVVEACTSTYEINHDVVTVICLLRSYGDKIFSDSEWKSATKAMDLIKSNAFSPVKIIYDLYGTIKFINDLKDYDFYEMNLLSWQNRKGD